LQGIRRCVTYRVYFTLGWEMFMKIAAMLVLMGSILLFDLRFFFPLAVILLLILNSMEKDLKKHERQQSLAASQEITAED
jgi:hypothetical protein